MIAPQVLPVPLEIAQTEEVELYVRMDRQVRQLVAVHVHIMAVCNIGYVTNLRRSHYEAI
jgi:hypothetical protein